MSGQTTQSSAAAVIAHIDRLDSWQDRRASMREQLRVSVAAQRERNHAARILDEQRSKRTAEREARADAARSRASASTDQLAQGRKPNLALLAARRRDQYRAALSYPMTPVEVLAACEEAMDSARLPHDDDRDEARSILIAHVMGRHGTAPLRCDVGREWLRERAHFIYQRERQRRERATGLRASAQLREQWHSDDADETRDSGPDAIWHLAANTAAPADSAPLDADQVAARLQLTQRQTDAIALALDAAQRVTAALTGAQRKSATDARAILRQRYPTVEALRVALRGPQLAAALAVERAIGIERQRAAASARGSHLSGHSQQMADPMRPILRAADQRLTRADRVWSYGLAARTERQIAATDAALAQLADAAAVLAAALRDVTTER